jgi:two-component sensor histidine kinase
MNAPDAYRALDCWLWRIDPATGQVVTLGGCSPFGRDDIGWLPILRASGRHARHAILDAVRLLRASDADGSLRLDAIAVPAAAGHRHAIDMVISRQRDKAGAEAWAGVVLRRWPSARTAVPLADEPAGRSHAPDPEHPAAGPARSDAAPIRSAPPLRTGMDRDSLVREIHHRIKNHLQGMTGLIERYRSDHPVLGEALDAISGQLNSIGTVYGLLARSGRTDLALSEIAQAVTDGVRGIAVNGITTRFADGSDPFRIGEQHCVAIALVVNELLMNAIKHGGAERGLPPVTVACERLPGGCLLRICNAGTLPPGFDFDAGTGTRTGLQLVRAMLPSRGARLRLHASGTQVEVTLDLAAPVLSDPLPVTDGASHPEGMWLGNRTG